MVGGGGTVAVKTLLSFQHAGSCDGRLAPVSGHELITHGVTARKGGQRELSVKKGGTTTAPSSFQARVSLFFAV